MSKVIQFRPMAKGMPHPYEIVEIQHYTMAGDGEYWVYLAGPYIAPPGSNPGGRQPCWRVTIFPAGQLEEAAHLVRTLSADFNVRIVDVAGVMPTAPEAA